MAAARMARESREGTSRPDPPARTIKPLKLHHDRLPILAVTIRDGGMTPDGTSLTMDEVCHVIETEGPGVLVTNDAHNILHMLEERFGRDDRWQVKVTARENTIAHKDERIRIRKTIIGFLGFKRRDYERGRNRYWHVLDPTVFLDDAKAAMPLAELTLWADDILEWCAEQGIRIRPTAGGLAGQLLRHPRFYPDARRKVPGATNERVREALPGNHYELRAGRDKRYVADYIDQNSAHHHAAIHAAVPDSMVYALGYFRDMRDEPWCDPEDLDGQYGLMRVKMHSPGHHEYFTEWDSARMVKDYRPAWAQTTGSHLAYLYTNELPLAEALGCRIEYVTAAWLSSYTDPGLQRYARWALREVAAAEPERRAWLKRVLLTPYGLLAAKPDHFEVGFRRAKGGETGYYPIAGRMVPFQVHRTKRPVHPRIANVVQRGLIEAFTRAESITFANQLLSEGEHVLCIYSDGILVRTLPWRTRRELLPEPWRWKARLTDLRFIHEQAFESREIVRLPGIPVAGRERSAMTTATI